MEDECERWRRVEDEAEYLTRRVENVEDDVRKIKAYLQATEDQHCRRIYTVLFTVVLIRYLTNEMETHFIVNFFAPWLGVLFWICKTLPSEYL